MGTDVDSFKVWERMGTIKLEEMDSIKLMNRVDTKYLTTESVLEKVLEKAADNGYRALEVEGSTISPLGESHGNVISRSQNRTLMIK